MPVSTSVRPTVRPSCVRESIRLSVSNYVSVYVCIYLCLFIYNSLPVSISVCVSVSVCLVLCLCLCICVSVSICLSYSEYSKVGLKTSELFRNRFPLPASTPSDIPPERDLIRILSALLMDDPVMGTIERSAYIRGRPRMRCVL